MDGTQIDNEEEASEEDVEVDQEVNAAKDVNHVIHDENVRFKCISVPLFSKNLNFGPSI